MGYNEFYDNIDSITEKVSNLVNENKDIMIVSNASCDGIVSASVLIGSIWKSGGKATSRFVNEFTQEYFDQLRNENHEFYFFTDIGTGLSEFFNKLFYKDWTILDHKKLSPTEITTDDNNAILNPWKYDIDGGKEITSGGISYLLAKKLDRSYSYLSPLAIVSALGENQDVGDKRSLVGLNREILKDSKKYGMVQTDIDLLLSFNEFLPIHEAIANTFIPYLHGLTSNVNKCLDILNNSNITLKKDGKWRTISDTTQEEKFLIIDTIKNYLSSQINSNIEEIENMLIGYNYILPTEEYGSYLYDARRFSDLLSTCTYNCKFGLGVTICLGERSESLHEAEKVVQEFKDSSQKLISKILKEKWRVSDKGTYVLINVDGTAETSHIGYLSRLITSHYLIHNKTTIMKISMDENYSKYFLTTSLLLNLDVEGLVKELSDSIDGITVIFKNGDAEITINTLLEDSLISSILKQIKI